jgi:hypothetical protein
MLSHPRRIGRSALRLSDAERERALRALKAHYAEGRLSTDELEGCVEGVYRSGTHHEVATYLRGLPLRGIRRLVVSRVRRFERAVLRMHALTYITANAALVGIWALTSQGIFWPAWLLIPSTALLGWHIVLSRTFSRVLSRRGW